VVTALSRLALGELEEADAWLGLAAAAGPRFAREPSATTLLARLYRARLVGEVADAGPAVQGLLAPAAGVAAGTASDDHRTLAVALLGAAQLWSGQLDDAAGTLERARADAGRRGRDVVALAVTAHLALLEAVRGRLGRAEELAREATEHARRVDWSASPQLACADLALAVCAYHRDDLGAAVAALDRARGEALPGDRPVRLAAAILAAWLAAGGGAGDAETALARLDEAVAATRGRPPRLLRAAAEAGRAKLLAAVGDEAAASALDPDDAGRAPVEAVVSARLQLARGDPAAAVRTLAPVLPGAPGEPPELPLAIEACLMDAVASHELADHPAAVRSLRLALDLAAPEGYRRMFVEGGTPVRMLLAEHLHWDSTHHLLVGSLLERLRSAAPPDGRAALANADAPAPLVVPLSEREQVVLRYLSSRLSAGEIADELYVSLNTVKTHIKSIYRKLDTNRRWDAVKRARQLQLL
jgi:LuxR family maltose regulon positive regulatory protein